MRPSTTPSTHTTDHRRLVLAAAAFLLLVGAPGTLAQEAGGASAPLPEIGGGELLRRGDAGWSPLPVLDIDVRIEVTGVMSRGSVTQTFVNSTDAVVEVLYAFPLPTGAAVNRMEMTIGDRRIVSEIREKQEARRTYEAARATGRKAALVDQVRGDLFTTRAANVAPGESIVVRLEYLETVEWRDGRFHLRFPLRFTPRFTPRVSPPSTDAGKSVGEPRGRRIDDSAPPATPIQLRTPRHSMRGAVPEATIGVRLNPGFELETIESGSHDLVRSKTEGGVELRARSGAVVADRDFVLSWAPVRGAAPETVVFVEERDDERFALIVLLPPAEQSDAGLGMPTETLFIVDVSGSMDGPSIVQAREALQAALRRLRPEDTFNLLRFNEQHAEFRGSFVHADPAAIAAASRWVGGLRASGGTMIHPALMKGLSLLGDSRSSRAQRIVFLTDGAVSNEQQLLEAIAREIGDARLHTIAIGHAPNGYLMRKMAAHGRGLCEFIASADSPENEIDRFFARLERPVWSDIELRFGDADAVEVYPERIPDLHAGEPLILSARFAGATLPESIALAGYDRNGYLRREVPLKANARPDSGVATRWARSRVAALMDSLHEGLPPDRVRDEVLEIGLAFNLVTRFTSLVAVERRVEPIGASAPRVAAATLPLGGTDDSLRTLVGVALAALGVALLIAGRYR